MKKIIIALEGLPNSGKTSCMKYLSTKYKDILYIPEIYLEQEHNNHKAMREKYALAELIKYKQYYKYKDKILICDRSFISTLAFSYTRYKTYKDKSDYNYNIKFLSENKNKILFPSHVIIFNIKAKESVLRNKKKNNTDYLEDWNNINFLNNFNDYYNSISFKKLTNKSKVYRINTKNKEKTRIIVEKIINDIIK